MSNKFKRNTPINTLTPHDKDYIEEAENNPSTTRGKYSKKEITFPLSARYTGLLEKIYEYHDRDISKRKIGAKALALGIEKEAERLGLSIQDSEIN